MIEGQYVHTWIIQNHTILQRKMRQVDTTLSTHQPVSSEAEAIPDVETAPVHTKNHNVTTDRPMPTATETESHVENNQSSSSPPVLCRSQRNHRSQINCHPPHWFEFERRSVS